MKNWIRIKNHYINLDLIIGILRGKERYNWRTLKTPVCESPNCNLSVTEGEWYCAKCLAEKEAAYQEMKRRVERRLQERYPGMTINKLFRKGGQS